jgi:predicted MFS family arabinose efflux permease
MFIIGTDIFIASPLLPTLRGAFGVSVEQSGWIVSAYSLGYAVFALVAGPLSDGWNRKKVMIAGMIGFGLATMLCGWAESFWSMLLFRFLAGICGAFVSPQIWASIPQLVKPGQVLKVMGIATSGLAVSQVLGVPIGSYLAELGWSAPFFIIGGCSFAAVALVAVLLPSIPPAQGDGSRPSLIGRYTALLGGTGPKLAFAAYFAFQIGNYATLSFTGTWLSDRFGLGVADIGTVILFIGLGSLLSSLISGDLVRKTGLRTAFFGGMTLLAALFLAYPLAPNLTAVKVLGFTLNFLMGMLFPVMMTLLQSLSAAARGTISSLANSSMYLAATLGSSAAGVLYANMNGFGSVCLFSSLFFAASLLVFARSGVLAVKQPAH